jgi:hypothetical protein
MLNEQLLAEVMLWSGVVFVLWATPPNRVRGTTGVGA